MWARFSFVVAWFSGDGLLIVAATGLATTRLDQQRGDASFARAAFTDIPEKLSPEARSIHRTFEPPGKMAR